jgi:hypothetical protein
MIAHPRVLPLNREQSCCTACYTQANHAGSYTPKSKHAADLLRS